MEFINAISICSGIGGLDLGLRLAEPRLRTICYTERESYAAATLVARMEDSVLDKAPIWDDVTKFPSHLFSGKVDFVFGGIPCQPFSMLGKRKKLADERWLWEYFWDIVQDTGARGICIENVAVFKDSGLGAVLQTLAEYGWIAEWGLFSAKQCGASHSRVRFFLVAYDMAYADCFRSRPSCDSVQDTPNADGQGEISAFISTRPYFPPQPTSSYYRRKARNDFSAYFEPSIRRMVDGDASDVYRCVESNRLDRLRCLGNAVVPITAAVAYRTLNKRIFEAY